jgi:hypothetical protein
MQGAGSGFPVWRSTDGGRVWQKPNWSFSFWPEAFVQFGKANAGAPDAYAYLLDARGTAVHLMRVPTGSAQTRLAYEYFSGTTDRPAWTGDSRRSNAISPTAPGHIART